MNKSSDALSERTQLRSQLPSEKLLVTGGIVRVREAQEGLAQHHRQGLFHHQDQPAAIHALDYGPG